MKTTEKRHINSSAMSRGSNMYQVMGRYLLSAMTLALLFAPFAAQAKSPWKWKFSMKGDQQENGIMVMPSSLFVDQRKERYYVTDSGNNRLVSFDKSGNLLSTFNANDALDRPFDMVRDSSGDIWVLEKGKNSLTKIDFNEKKTTAHPLNVSTKRVYPARIAYFSNSFLILDKATGDILFFNKELKVEKRLSCPDCSSGFIDFKVKKDEIWALDQKQNSVYRFSAEGDLKSKIPLNDKLHFPYSFEIGPGGLIYVLDRHSGQVAVFNSNGKLKYRFLGHGHVRGKLYYPTEILFDPWGRLCIVDEGNGRVEVFSR